MRYNPGAALWWRVELSITFYHGEGGIAMTNEGLARRIQQGERDLLLQLWEQVQRYAHDRAYKWFRATNGRGGQTVQDLEQEAFLPCGSKRPLQRPQRREHRGTGKTRSRTACPWMLP